MELRQHPLSAAFPAMSADDFAALIEDIKVNGQREPIMLFEGMVLDGWHRYQACEQLGFKPQQFTFSGSDPVAFVLSHNLHRRHLTPSQRAAAVVACGEWAPAHRAKKVEPGSTFSKTNAEMAKAAQVTPRLITEAKAAHKAGLGDAVKAGAMTAKEAAAVARGKPTKPEKKPAPIVTPPAVNEDEMAEAQHTIADLSAENDQLRDRLAVEAMDASEDEKTQAAETIRELRALVKTLEAELSAVKVSRDTYMRENSEMKRQLSAQQRELKRLRAAA